MTTLPWEMIWSSHDQETCANAREQNPKLGNLFACYDDPPGNPPIRGSDVAISVAAFGVLPAFMVLIAGLMGRWVLRGFRAK